MQRFWQALLFSVVRRSMFLARHCFATNKAVRARRSAVRSISLRGCREWRSRFTPERQQD
jgi:hypothetical protein